MGSETTLYQRGLGNAVFEYMFRVKNGQGNGFLTIDIRTNRLDAWGRRVRWNYQARIIHPGE